MPLSDTRRFLRDWLSRARELIAPDDRRALFSASHLLGGLARRTQLRDRPATPTDQVGERDPALVNLFGDLFREIGQRYFRVRTLGVEHFPTTGPVLLVGNHSGGIVTIDSFLAAVAIADAHGVDRAPFALAHDFLFDDPVVGKYAARLGILRAGHDSARHALRAGHPVLVYPGSDWDAFRPYRDRNRVILAGRKGFLKLALREQVPIVPVVCAGSQEQFIVLTRGDRLARALGLHRLARVSVFPIVLSLPWGLTSGLLPYFPLPTQITIGFGEPIRWPDLGPEAADDEAALNRCYSLVEGRMQTLLDHLIEVRSGRSAG